MFGCRLIASANALWYLPNRSVFQARSSSIVLNCLECSDTSKSSNVQGIKLEPGATANICLVRGYTLYWSGGFSFATRTLLSCRTFLVLTSPIRSEIPHNLKPPEKAATVCENGIESCTVVLAFSRQINHGLVLLRAGTNRCLLKDCGHGIP